MQVILTDDVFRLGKRGQTVKVADGYARNYLLPRRLAVLATPANMKMVEQQRLALAKKEAKFKEEAQVLAAELNTLHLIISRKAGDTGALFGSVTSKDVADLLEGQGFSLDRRKIVLEHPIKAIGNYTIEIHPHNEVQAQVALSVQPEEEEPVAEVRKKDEESGRIIAALDAKVQEIQQQQQALEPVEETVVTPAEPKKPKSPKKEVAKPEAGAE